MTVEPGIYCTVDGPWPSQDVAGCSANNAGHNPGSPTKSVCTHIVIETIRPFFLATLANSPICGVFGPEQRPSHEFDFSHTAHDGRHGGSEKLL